MMKRSPSQMLCVLLACIGLVLSLSLPYTVRAQVNPGVTVTGRVVNGTPGGEVSVGAPVELHVFDGADVTSTYTSIIEPDATFRFNDVTLKSGREFAVSTSYQGVRYTSEPTTLSTDWETGVEVWIYESTEDNAHIHIEQAHLFLVPGEEKVHIAEVYSASNTGDRTYVGKQTELASHTTLSFTLPAEADNLSVPKPGLEARYEAEESVLADTQPIIPGIASVEVRFSYTRPYREGMHLTRDLSVPIQSVLLLIQDGGLSVEGAGLSFNGMIETQMGNAASYLAGPFAADEMLDVTITSQPSLNAPSEATAFNAWGSSESQTWGILLGVGALAVAGLATFVLWTSPSVPETPESARPLLTAIAQLDRAYGGGEMDEATYQTQRAALKQKLQSHLERHED